MPPPDRSADSTEADLLHVQLLGDHTALAPLLDLVAEELNVKEVAFAESADRFGRWRAKPNFKVLGPRLGGGVKDLAEVLASDDGTLAGTLADGDPVTVGTPGGEVVLTPDDVDLSQDVVEGWGVASDGGITVALDLELTPELRSEGLAREVVRVVQDARRTAGLDVSDRIVLGLASTGAVADAISAHAGTITAETLAVELREDLDDEGAPSAEVDGTPVRVQVRRA